MRPTARELLNGVFERVNEAGKQPRPRWTQVLEGRSLHVDYGEDSPVFLVTVQEVPRRRWTPEQPVTLGPVDGIIAQLVGVTVDNFVHVRLTAAPSAERDQLTREHDEQFQRWAESARQAPGGQGEAPPESPAVRLRQVLVTIADEFGTPYELAAAKYGGSDTEWDARQSFRPAPPTGAHQLALSLRTPGGLTVRVPVPLTSPGTPATPR